MAEQQTLRGGIAGGGCAGCGSGGGGGAGRKWFWLACLFLILNAVWYVHWMARGDGQGGTPRLTEIRAGDDGVARADAPVLLTFSTAMIGDLECGKPLAAGMPAIEPAVAGTWTWLNPRQLQFVPAGPWNACTEYQVRFPPGLVNAAGRRVSLPEPPRFHSDGLKLLETKIATTMQGGEFSLVLLFNAAPNLDALRRCLKIVSGDVPLDFGVVGSTARPNVMVRARVPSADVTEFAVVVTVPAGLPPLKGTLGTAVTTTHTLTLSGAFASEAVAAVSPSFGPGELLLDFSDAPDLAVAATAITVAPPVAFTVAPLAPTYEAQHWWSYGLKLYGDFVPGRTYTCTVTRGMRSLRGQALGKDEAHTLVFPKRKAALALTLEGRYLPPSGALRVPLAAVNVPACKVSVAPVLPQNLAFLALREEEGNEYYGREEATALAANLTGLPVSQTVALRAADNVEARLLVNLREFAGGDPRGVFLLKAETDPGVPAGMDRATPVSRLLVVSNLGVSVKTWSGGVLAWVTSLPDAKPVAGAAVVVYAKNNAELARGSTDRDGVVRLAYAVKTDAEAKTEATAPYLVTAMLGRDLTFLPLDPNRVELAPQGPAATGVYLKADGLEAFVFTDRGIYRPGETVHIESLVRNAQLQAPEPFPCLVRVTKPDGKVYRDLPVTLNERGAAEAVVDLPDFLPTGRYGVTLVLPGTFAVLGDTSVRLEDFVPPQIVVEVKDAPPRLAAGRECKLVVAARHLFGRPADGLRAEASLVVAAVAFRPAGWDGWQFGDDARETAPLRRSLGKQTLDAAGQAAFRFTVDPKLQPAAVLRATVEATVLEANGRPVAQDVSVAVDPYPYYLGVRNEQEGGHVRTGQSQRWRLAAVLPDGGKATAVNATLRATLAQVRWESVLRRSDQENRYAWQSVRRLQVESESTVTLKNGVGECTFTPKSRGEYRLTLTDSATGVATAVVLLAAEPGQYWVAWAKDKPECVELSLDRKSYQPGETARLVVKAPFSGPALLTVESDRVLEHRLVVLEKNTAELELPVRADYVPNVYATVSLLRPAVPEAVWSAHRAAGTVCLPVAPADRRLQVEVTVPREMLPQGALAATVAVRAANGSAVPGAEVVVAAVDEGILLLTAFPNPDPLAHFLAPRQLEVETSDLYALLMPLLEDAVSGAASAPGGDAGGEAFLRRRLNPVRASRFRPVALWTAGALTDAQGRVAVNLAVPEFTGQLRVVAVAFDRTRAGVAAQPVRVKRKLVVQPGLPRFAAPGDSFRSGITVFNETGADQKLAWALGVNELLRTQQPAEGELLLAAGKSVTQWVELLAGTTPGVATCAFRVSGGGERYSEQLELAVRPAAPPVARSRAGRLEAGQEAALSVPADWLASSVSWSVQAGAMPEVRLKRSLDYLLQYPHGCLEQTTSSAFPLLYLEDLVTSSRPRGLEQGKTGPFLQAAVWRLLAMQTQSGGFGMWPDSSVVAGWACLYAVHFLVEAQKAGVEVPPDRLQLALGWVRSRLEYPAPGVPGGDEWRTDMNERAYACLVLARAGKPAAGWVARLQEQADKLGPGAVARLAMACLYAGNPRAAGALLGAATPAAMDDDDAKDTDGARAETGLVPLNEVIDQALLLAAWVDLDVSAAAVPLLVRALEQKMQEGHWGTTHADALALMALGKYARAQARRAVQPFQAECRLDGGDTVAFDQTRMLRRFSSRPGEWKGVMLVNKGPGPLWYAVTMEGVPPVDKLVQGDTGGLEVRREWFDAAGKPLTQLECAAGDRLHVRLTLTAREAIENVAVTDLLPAGLELENPGAVVAEPYANISWLWRREARDDRLLLFTGSLSGSVGYSYSVRAVTPGRFVVPPVLAEAMYNPAVRSLSGRGSLTVR